VVGGGPGLAASLALTACGVEHICWSLQNPYASVVKRALPPSALRSWWSTRSSSSTMAR
jgi:hypothetical protein